MSSRSSGSSVAHASKFGFSRCLVPYGDVTRVGHIFQLCRWFEGVFLDSGAYSVWSTGKRIDLDRYIAFCKSVGSVVEVYANLDVIGDWRETAANQARMEAAGLAPLPTFHHGSPLHELERLVETYGYLGLGGIARLSRPKRIEWLDTVWPIIRASTRWPLRVHGWGVTDSIVMERYPWYSVDSTTWTVGSWYGSSLVRRGRLPVQKREQLPPALKLERNSVSRLMRLRHTARALIDFQRYVTNLWKSRGIDWEEIDGNSATS